MYKILTKVLTGISAAICGLALSGLFASPVQAATTASTQTIYVWDSPSAGGADSTGSAVGTVNFQFTSSSTSFVPGAEVSWLDANNCLFLAYVDFPSAAEGSTGTAEYNFTYMGNTYSGEFTLVYSAPADENGNVYYYTIMGSEMIIGSWSDLVVWYFEEDEESPMSQEIAGEINDIKLVSNGLNPDGTVSADKTITIEGKGALNSNVIKTLANADGVTVNYTYEYQGYRFMSTITSEGAAKIFSEDIAWYGPCFLANNFPTAMIGVVE